MYTLCIISNVRTLMKSVKFIFFSILSSAFYRVSIFVFPNNAEQRLRRDAEKTEMKKQVYKYVVVFFFQNYPMQIIWKGGLVR